VRRRLARDPCPPLQPPGTLYWTSRPPGAVWTHGCATSQGLFGRAPAPAPRAAPAGALPNVETAPAPGVEPELEPLAAFKGEVEPRFGGFTGFN
jgi:hypothetical protein